MLVSDYNIKREFRRHFTFLLCKEKVLTDLFHEVFRQGTAYVVGGYFRDFINKKNNESRDIDVIVDVNQTCLLKIINNLNCSFDINRHGGIKLHLQTIEMDIWCLEDNWAFKNELVKLNEEDKLHSIAKGCFYNYDALVIDLKTFSYNLKYYKEFYDTKKLNILQVTSKYKTLNPTTEANIIRAIYLKHKFDAIFTKNTHDYVIKKLGDLEDKYKGNVMPRLLEVKAKYPKYNDLSNDSLINYIRDLEKNLELHNQQISLFNLNIVDIQSQWQTQSLSLKERTVRFFNVIFKSKQLAQY